MRFRILPLWKSTHSAPWRYATAHYTFILASANTYLCKYIHWSIDIMECLCVKIVFTTFSISVAMWHLTFNCWNHHPAAHPNSLVFSIILYQQLSLNGNGDSKSKGSYSLEDVFKVFCLVTREVTLCFIYLVLYMRKCVSACVPLQSKQIHCGIGA